MKKIFIAILVFTVVSAFGQSTQSVASRTSQIDNKTAALDQMLADMNSDTSAITRMIQYNELNRKIVMLDRQIFVAHDSWNKIRNKINHQKSFTDSEKAEMDRYAAEVERLIGERKTLVNERVTFVTQNY